MLARQNYSLVIPAAMPPPPGTSRIVTAGPEPATTHPARTTAQRETATVIHGGLSKAEWRDYS